MKELEVVYTFLKSLGINLEFRKNIEGFMPGLTIDRGTIVIDPEALKYPGDILHEAGHIAIVKMSERIFLNSNNIAIRKDAAAEEMMAIAWSFAACLHLNIPPEFVFHEQGYNGGGLAIAENFKQGHYFGVPMLVFAGMCENPGPQGYPLMKIWTRA